MTIVPVGWQLGAFTVELDDVLLGVVDDAGAHLHVASLDGWWSAPSSTGTVDQRAADDGGWLTPAYRAPRVIALEVRLNGTDWDHVGAALDRVQARIPLATLKPFTVDEAGSALRAMVRQHGDTAVARSGASARLSMSLIAPDPRRYGISPIIVSTGLPSTSGGLAVPLTVPFSIGATVASGVLQVTNSGTASTAPKFTVSGPCPPFTITHRGSGAVLSYPDAVDAGRVVVIDTATRTALLDGTAARYVAGSWFQYAPGVNEVAFSAASYNAGALLTSEHFDAWL